MRTTPRWLRQLIICIGLIPGVSNAVPVLYSFSGELTSFYSNLDGATRTLESLSSREIFGFVAYDTELLESPDSETFILSSRLHGDGFEFEANSARIPGSQAIYIGAEEDKAIFFEYFEYDLFTYYATTGMQIDLYGEGLDVDPTRLDVTRFTHGEGNFFSSRYFPATEMNLDVSGTFTVKQLWEGPVPVPETSTIALFACGLMFLFVQRRGIRNGRPRSLHTR